MLKKTTLGILLVIIAASAFGCPAALTSTPTQPSNVKTIRETTIAPDWAMKQMEIVLEGDTSIVLKLATGDEVDGYFYVEDDKVIYFIISGTSLIYESYKAGSDDKKVSSDRFSFVATTLQGIAYTLQLNPANDASIGAKVVIELIYPASGEIFIPIGTK